MKKLTLAIVLACALYARAEDHRIDSFASICGKSTDAVRCSVGDTVTLPAGGVYTVVNSNVAVLDGNVITVKSTGFTGVIDGSGAIGGIIALPKPAGSGRVFIAVCNTSEKASSGQNFFWCNKANWINADGTAADRWPNGADDVAIIPTGWSAGDFTSNGTYLFNLVPSEATTGSKLADLDHQITIGEIYLGVFGNEKINYAFFGYGEAGRFVFARTDGKTPRFVYTGAAAGKAMWVHFSKYGSGDTNKPSLDLSQGLDVDMGYVGGAATDDRPRLLFECGAAVLPKDRYLTVENGRPNYIARSALPTIVLSAPFSWSGEGKFCNDSDAFMRVDQDVVFPGDYEVGGRLGSKYESEYPYSAGLDLFGYTGEGKNVVVDGYVTSPSLTASYFAADGGGTLKIGYGSKSSELSEGLRSVGRVTLRGGNFGIWSAAGGTKIFNEMVTRVDRLTLGLGTSKLHIHGRSDATYPTNVVRIVKAESVNRAQAFVFMADLFNAGVVGGYYLSLQFLNHEDIVLGDVIPWLVAYGKSNANGPLFFPTLDANGFVSNASVLKKVVLSAAEPGGNIRLADKGSLSLAEDLAVNTIVAGSVSGVTGSSLHFGEGRTLTVTAGAVALPPSSGFGEEGSTENGVLKFSAPGYVFSSGLETTAAKIHVPMVAEKGLAFGYPGYTLVTGDQTGVKEEFVVNGCTVTLGTATTKANLDVDVRVAGGKACLNVVNVDVTFLKKHNLAIEDARNFPARVNLAAGEYPVQSLVINGVAMKGGRTYGSSASGASVKDDIHFAGVGVVSVFSPGLMLIVR